MKKDISYLIKHCKKQDRKAQFGLYQLFYKAMFNAALRVLQDRSLAEDVMQESFLYAFSELDKLKDPNAFGGWLKKIVINKAINTLKVESRLRKDTLDEVLYKVDEDNKEADFLQYKTDKVIHAIYELKENYRVLLTLHFLEGYDYEEITEIMEISYANCRTMMSRAKESLKKHLDLNTLKRKSL